jgi:tRNA-splicing ligase RtcB
MGPRQESKKLVVWSDDIEPEALAQAARTSRLPFVAGHVALMPDAHYGKGACVGSVIPTAGAIIPAAVGVDIGCGMIAVRTQQTAAALPDSLDPLMSLTEARIPAGVGEGHGHRSDAALAWFARHERTDFDARQEATTVEQFGTLGSGNHFVEVCVDESEGVWLVLHSGSRGIGNRLAQKHIKVAQRLAETYFIPLEDPDLAYLPQSTPEFKAYIDDLMWAQAYALANREQMMDELVRSLAEILGLTPDAVEAERINCHHNYTAIERHRGRDLWITRKGAIKAGPDDRGVIPGSMGTRSYIVRGRGSAASYHSCSHGAGRRLSRSQARKALTVDSLTDAMGARVWNADRAGDLVDEHPEAYKDIDTVMADQADLVAIEHTLSQVFNYKG